MKILTKRQYQIGEKIKRTLSIMFRTGIFADRFKDYFSITEVSPSPGYQTAWIFISALDPSKNDFIVSELNKMTDEIRFELANTIKLKFTPILIFKFDNSLEYANNIEKILNSPEIKSELSQQ